ncbi:MAG TPA: cyclic 2,3-diphosphoglycerate synthase [Candidatus Polarisedimenticolia bacterium]|nr:cyclic 2,3-diphosphoglycerate synthase [Candidatus Polarisedimenticolia bacterium]
MPRRRVIIMGAAGRDFHNFNVAFREDSSTEVVCFTATQIPNIAGRRYPAALAGPLYPDGIPIHEERLLSELIVREKVQEVIFAYSDVSHEHVMHHASAVNAAGADFRLMGADATMLASKVPVVSICAVRTGSGKSQTTRKVCQALAGTGRRVVVVRHPMPYGDLVRQKVQRFASFEDLDAQECTIEEREEYEPHIRRGTIVYAGVDYGAILQRAQEEADVIVWDGGNNDMPFFRPRLEIVVADPHRAGHEMTYHPGETNLRRAQIIVINKVDSAPADGVAAVRRSIEKANPRATVIEAASPITVEDPAAIRGKRVLAIEDGPTLTHGEMTYGAAVVAARAHGAAGLVDPRSAAVGTIKEAFAQYPGIGTLLPALGYGDRQIADLQATIERVDCDLVLIGTPIDLRRLVKFKKPAQTVAYELEEKGRPTLADLLASFA